MRCFASIDINHLLFLPARQNISGTHDDAWSQRGSDLEESWNNENACKNINRSFRKWEIPEEGGQSSIVHRKQLRLGRLWNVQWLERMIGESVIEKYVVRHRCVYERLMGERAIVWGRCGGGEHLGGEKRGVQNGNGCRRRARNEVERMIRDATYRRTTLVRD